MKRFFFHLYRREMYTKEYQRQLALWDLLAVSINTAQSCSTTNGFNPNKVIELLVLLNTQRRPRQSYCTH
jgi:hypothetical protein